MSHELAGGGTLQPRQLKGAVYERLRQQIIDFEYRPGDPLREADLARRLGVSKTPIREALLRLHEDRLVSIQPYRGAIVAGYTRDDLRHIYGLRELVEGACARDAAREVTADDLRDFDRIIEQSRRSLRDSNHDLTAALLSEFDDLIYRQTRNPYIAAIITTLHAHLARIAHLTLRIPGRFARSLEEHEAIHDAIVRRDEDAAEQRMRDHVRSVVADHLGNFVDVDGVELPHAARHTVQGEQ